MNGRCVLVAGADSDTFDLLAEWLAEAGATVLHELDAPPASTPDLLVVDVPFARHGGERLAQLRSRHGAAPVLMLSATFLPGVARSGEAARALGASRVLPKPLQRELLLEAVRELIGEAR
jgi:CheY-like chemotaxis protein